MSNNAFDEDSAEHHLRRSEFIRNLVQQPVSRPAHHSPYKHNIPKRIVQFWHSLQELPEDINQCVATWRNWSDQGFTHHLFDAEAAGAFIRNSLGPRYLNAFECCYHPAMQADYFRLCYLCVEGGFYVDADDAYVGGNIDFLFEDSRLKLQPLCYDINSGGMIKPSIFLSPGAWDPQWIFYFNNNPVISGRGHPIIERTLSKATARLELAGIDVLPEIQSTTGPGILSESIFDIGTTVQAEFKNDLLVLKDWESVAISKWPLSHRNDSRNWRLSNQKRFEGSGTTFK